MPSHEIRCSPYRSSIVVPSAERRVEVSFMQQRTFQECYAARQRQLSVLAGASRRVWGRLDFESAFREALNLKTEPPGLLSSLRLVLTVPGDQIEDIKPVMTILGGRVVYDAGAAVSATK